ncbi:ricin-type beta-trefoil lectin domain protein [Streptomyces phaeochromogenes]|uniref:ricin-type beta-trefoil lectin domain protein n=1 Tax=Streptomyces phaeochromogenes TaxID=1923 RepID=UPI0036BB4DF5
MVRGEGRGTGDDAGNGGGDGVGVHAGAADARLTELLRADTRTAYAALRELRLRHRPAVLAYARLCTTADSAARQLTDRAFALAAQETARGSDPGGPWRHQLLLLAGRVAVTWTGDERAGRLDPGLLARLRTAGPEGPTPPLLDAFRSLPSRVQGLAWYGIVEREPEETTAGLLGLTREDVTYGTEPALQALRASFLKSHLAASGDPHCQDFRRLIEESVRPDSPRHSTDLRAHMAECAHCATAYEELSALRDAPHTGLAEGLLPWGGTAYGTGAAARSRATAQTESATWGSLAVWPPSRRLVLASAALGVALAPLLLFLLTSGGSGPDTAGSAGDPLPPPAVTVTATVPTAPSASPTGGAGSPSPTKSSRPSKPASPTPSHPTSSPPAAPAPAPPNGSYAQVVNRSTGRCLDIRDGDMEKGTDVITAPCSSSGTQRWRVDAERGALQSYADPDFCLDSRGATDDGVGIWECDSLGGRNAVNLRFAVTADGVIRPAVAPDHALTPYGDDGLDLAPDTGRTEQLWRAGAGPA